MATKKNKTLRALVRGPVCKHCGKENCYTHCYATESGNHEVDATSASRADGYDGCSQIIIDVNCKHCGQAGSGSFQKKDIQWD